MPQNRAATWEIAVARSFACAFAQRVLEKLRHTSCQLHQPDISLSCSQTLEDLILPYSGCACRLTQFFQGVQLTIPFTLAAYMVRGFEQDKSEQVIGQLTGLLAAAAPFARFIGSFPWGMVSDYTGRKVCSSLMRAESMLMYASIVLV